MFDGVALTHTHTQVLCDSAPPDHKGATEGWRFIFSDVLQLFRSANNNLGHSIKTLVAFSARIDRSRRKQRKASAQWPLVRALLQEKITSCPPSASHSVAGKWHSSADQLQEALSCYLKKKPDGKRLGKICPIERPHQFKQVREIFFKFKGAVLLIDQVEMDDLDGGKEGELKEVDGGKNIFLSINPSFHPYVSTFSHPPSFIFLSLSIFTSTSTLPPKVILQHL